ncbi:MAG: YicC family protein [Nitrospinota bacterium]|nr:YicC family protein [Nitrospinota bacterium]
MANSMTGYGQGEHEEGGIRVSVEARSVNHRFIEVNVKSPQKNLALEDIARKMVKARFSRGAFDIFITIEITAAESVVRVNEPLLKGYLKVAADLSEQFGITYPPTFGDLASVRDMFLSQGAEAGISQAGPVMEGALALALEKLGQMRASEGERIIGDLKQRLAQIGGWTEEIKKINEGSSQERYDALKEKIAKLVGDLAMDQGRLAQEAAMIAERGDISEEITRLESHLQEGAKALEGDGPMGRKFEFLLQEFGRETNTIGSKSNSTQLTALALNIKGELEKLREQVQNLE